MILTQENFDNLLNLVNAPDKESEELFTSFYKQICIKENVIWLLLLMKLSTHRIEHFRTKYPDIFKIIPNIDADIASIQYLSYDFLTKYTDLAYITKDSVEYLMKRFCMYLIEEVLRKSGFKTDTMELKLIKLSNG